MQALVQTFHIDHGALAALSVRVDEAVGRFSQNPSFGGLLCLEKEGGSRTQVTVVVVWRADALDEFAPEVDEAHRLIAATTDLGVTSRFHRVVRFEPGPAGLGAFLTGIA